MERIETLTKKVHLAAEQLVRMKKEQERLISENKYLQEEHKRVLSLSRENEQLRGRQAAMAARLEKVLAKLKHE